jgi:hypothetical protein
VTPPTTLCDPDAELNLAFARVGFLVVFTVTAKQGHDIYWVQFKNDVDGGKPVSPPEFIYIERVYDRIPMAASLGFGGANMPRLNPGDPITADYLNRHEQAADAVQGRGQRPSAPLRLEYDTNRLTVKNTSGADRRRGGDSRIHGQPADEHRWSGRWASLCCRSERPHDSRGPYCGAVESGT